MVCLTAGDLRSACPQAPAKGSVDTSAAMVDELLRWGRDHGRHFPWRSWTDPYRLLVVEVLLRQTRAETVAGFLLGFFYEDTNTAQRSPAPPHRLLFGEVLLRQTRAETGAGFIVDFFKEYPNAAELSRARPQSLAKPLH